MFQSNSLFCSKSRIASAIAALAMTCGVGTAHATFPGANGVIVFDNPNTGMIGRAAPTGGGVTYLQQGTSPSVSPSGKRIAYLSNGNVYVMNIDGSNAVQVNGSGSNKSVAWRVDGKLEFAVQTMNGTEIEMTLYQANADGSGLTMTAPTTSQSAFNQRTQIVSIAASSKNEGAYVMIDYPLLPPSSITPTSDGFNWGNMSPFVNPRIAGGSPSFSPDGASILYTPTFGSIAREIFIDGTNDHAVPASGLAWGTNAASPDFALIAAAIGDSPSAANLQIRPRTGGNPSVQWQEPARNVDWSRVPRNCLQTSSQGGDFPAPGGSANAEFYGSQCAIVYMPDAGAVGGLIMQAIAVGPDGRTYHAGLKSGAGATWSSWNLTSGVGSGNGMNASKVALAGAKDGSLQVVVVGSDDVVYHTVRNADGTWQPQGFAPVLHNHGVFQARDVSITINADSATSPGNAQIVANGLGLGAVYHCVRWGNGSWSDFAPVPSAGGVNTSELAIAAAPDGNTYVLATVRSNLSQATAVKRQVRYPNGSWDSDFRPVYTPNLLQADSDIALTITPSGKAQFMYTDLTGAFLEEFPNPSVSSGWTQPVSSVPIAPGSKSVSISAPPSATGASAVLSSRTSAQ